MPQNRLPDYSVRTSSRAKHVRLKVSAKEGVVVIIPRGFDEKRIPGLLEKRRSWLKGQITRIGDQQRFLQSCEEDVLPEVVALNALGQNWQVEYKATRAKTVAAIAQNEGRLVVQGNIDDRTACRAALRRWLSRQAHAELSPWLTDLSQTYSLPFEKTMVKGQKTRWASCSRKKTISINYKLLFLNKRLVRYVFLHELCHTVYMNHSDRFWVLVGGMEQDYKALHEQIRNGWREVPVWVGQN